MAKKIEAPPGLTAREAEQWYYNMGKWRSLYEPAPSVGRDPGGAIIWYINDSGHQVSGSSQLHAEQRQHEAQCRAETAKRNEGHKRQAGYREDRRRRIAADAKEQTRQQASRKRDYTG